MAISEKIIWFYQLAKARNVKVSHVVKFWLFFKQDILFWDTRHLFLQFSNCIKATVSIIGTLEQLYSTDLVYISIKEIKEATRNPVSISNNDKNSGERGMQVGQGFLN